jgi:hypothetical protein
MSAGVLSQISLGQEASWGGTVVPSKSIAVKPGDGIQVDNDIQLNSSIRAVLPKYQHSHIGKAKYEGEFEMDFIPVNIGYFLKSLFGGCNSAAKAGESIVYEHTLTEAETKPSLTIEQSVGEITRRFAGSIVNSMKLSVKEGEPVVANFGVKAKTHASATKISASYDTIRPFVFTDCLAADGVTIGGTPFNEVKNLELEFKNGVELEYALGSYTPQFSYVKASEVSGKFELYLNTDSATLFADYLAKTERAIVLTFTGDAIGSASNYKFALTLPRAIFKVATNSITEDFCMLSVEFEGLYDTVTSKLISAVLTNLTTSYAT